MPAPTVSILSTQAEVLRRIGLMVADALVLRFPADIPHRVAGLARTFEGVCRPENVPDYPFVMIGLREFDWPNEPDTDQPTESVQLVLWHRSADALTNEQDRYRDAVNCLGGLIDDLQYLSDLDEKNYRGGAAREYVCIDSKMLVAAPEPLDLTNADAPTAASIAKHVWFAGWMLRVSGFNQYAQRRS